jgi:hypothetical protein
MGVLLDSPRMLRGSSMPFMERDGTVVVWMGSGGSYLLHASSLPSLKSQSAQGRLYLWSANWGTISNYLEESLGTR